MNAPSLTDTPTPEISEGVVVQLQGRAFDETLPHGPLVTEWTLVSGPAPVVFADPSQVDSTATFTLAGTYVLRLTASDGEFSISDDVTVVVELPPTY